MLSRRGVSTALFGGMIAAAPGGMFMMSVLYVAFQWLREKVKGHKGPLAPTPAGQSGRLPAHAE